MIAEGRIIVDLGRPVRIRSSRAASVSGLLSGRRVDEALSLLPMLFSLCAHAHLAAARQATGREIGPADGLMVLAESAREHLLRILLGWKGDGAPEMPAEPVMALVPDMKAACEAGYGNAGTVAQALERYLEEHVFACPPADFPKADLARWLRGAETAPARYLRDVVARGWQGAGAVSPAFLPEVPAGELKQRMHEAGFCTTPEWRGAPRETGPLARRCRVPVVAAVVAEHGAGLLARLVARLADLALIPGEMRRAGMPVSGGLGLGVVETARGRLAHAARLEGDVIADYAILAPTEWNFHPRGVAAQALEGLAPLPARAVIEAIDPCVDFELRAA